MAIFVSWTMAATLGGHRGCGLERWCGGPPPPGVGPLPAHPLARGGGARRPLRGALLRPTQSRRLLLRGDRAGRAVVPLPRGRAREPVRAGDGVEPGRVPRRRRRFGRWLPVTRALP